ncbi:MAG: hypothetical protein WCD76_03535 [Pyrinomonadaceae bacterium]
MAEERDVALSRAIDSEADEDGTKAELQRRMEEARESITQTVTEIKETVANQYQQVKTTISDSLDWREQYKRRPVPFAVGALVGGALLGYTVAGVFKSDADDDDYDTEDAPADQALYSAPARSYAAQPILGAPAAYSVAPAYASASSADVGPETRPSYSSGYEAPSAQAEAEPSGPGLMERFKETQAYDRLQQELSTLGSRAVEELSKTAQNVVLPALLGKLKDLIGIDLGTQRNVATRSRLEHETIKTEAASDDVAEGREDGGASSAYASRADGSTGGSL